jgi:alpha-L-rhamnosidase
MLQRIRKILLTFVLLIVTAACASFIPPRISVRDDPSIEPWSYLKNGSFSGPAVPLSPDPLVRYQWSSTLEDRVSLQVYDLLPVAAVLTADTPSTSFSNLDSLMTINASVTVSGPGGFVVDIATESAAWVEIDSPDIKDADASLLVLGFSEWTADGLGGYPLKSATPKRYGNTFRLETNSELYEGVRYAFVSLTAAPSSPFTITAVRAVCQAKPVNYSGSFSASGDDLLTRIWYTSVYTVRLNFERDYFGAILVDRGDRISWTGDAHVAQAAAMSAFTNFDFVLQNLMRSANDCNGIESYCIYWTLSLMDYYYVTGDKITLSNLTQNVNDKLEHAFDIFEDYKTKLTFFGWDDRLGAGFMNASYMETQYDFRFLVLRAWSDWAALMSISGNATAAGHFREYVQTKSASLRATLGGDSWTNQLGTHASAEAINAPGFANSSEVANLLVNNLNNIVNICSLSNFNQYWILQGLGNAGAMDKAVASINRCWGSEIELGATSFWEISHPDWLLSFPTGPVSSIPHSIPFGENGQTSLCHPWSAGAAPWLTANILGVRPALPGYQKVSISPHMTQKMAKSGGIVGVVPSPHGSIELNINVSASVISIVIPSGCDGGADVHLSEVLLLRLGWLLEKGTLETVAVSIDRGHPIKLSAALNVHGPLFEDELAGLSDDRSAVAVLHISSGSHTISCIRNSEGKVNSERLHSHQHIDASPPFPPPSWPAQLVQIDTWTKGNWQGRFGSQGFVLASFSNASSSSTSPDVVKLPQYIASVRSSGRGTDTWVSPPPNDDVRALQDPAGFGRAIGCWYSMNSDFYDIWMDQNIESSGFWWQLAIYVVDYDNSDPSHLGFPPRKQTIALLNMHTLEPLAPVQYLDDYTQGVWIVYELNTSARVRFSMLHGDNNVLSAIMFDSVSRR